MKISAPRYVVYKDSKFCRSFSYRKCAENFVNKFGFYGNIFWFDTKDRIAYSSCIYNDNHIDYELIKYLKFLYSII